MEVPMSATSAEPAGLPARGPGRLLAVRLDGGALSAYAALGLVAALTVVVLAAPLIAPYNPIQPTGMIYLPPGSPGHLLGTDAIGRDIFSRVILGARTSWLISLAVVALGLAFGAAVGTIAGAAGGIIDAILMRVTDMFLALPAVLVAIAVAAALGPGLLHTFWAISVVWWPYYARIVRGEVRSLAARPHVEAARMAGIGRLRIMWRHLLPGVFPTAIVSASLDVGNVVLTLASLSFLGLGEPAPAPELGADTANGLSSLLSYYWIPVMPGLAITVLSLIANLGGDAVRTLITRRR
jgi:peptide/nickel transport system permease protein